ncbi:LysR family transcriptional regulator ArgP [Acetobacteraceae bacterium H6797]|nr:LysR family transcriptional regulator ArgP [Acetobacteraceae bacterium H6797]
MIDYPALAALAAVLREGSFERAAGALGVTPSAVSQRVRGLEERLGCALVVRGQPPVATGAGARLVAHYERVRLLESEVAEDLPALGGAGPGRLKVAVNADSLGTWFPPAAAGFAAASGVMLDLVLDDEGHTAERLRTGEVLAAVTADPSPVPGCRLIGLGALRFLPVASPGFVARHFADGVTEAALRRAPMLRFDHRDELQARWARQVLGVERLEAPAHWVPSTQGFLDMALVGLGWAMNPVQLAGPHLAAGRLVALHEEGLDVALHWQHARLGQGLMEKLTREVVAAARRGLVQG